MAGLHQSLPPGIPLVLKASCDERIKRIRFPPDLTTLEFDDFQRKIARSLQFDDVDFAITWEDDDGEYCDIASTDDLQEALLYFCPSEIGSSLQALNMRVTVRVDTSVSLSDFGSSVWEGSDDEGTVDSRKSKASQHSRRSGRMNSWSDRSSSTTSSRSSGSYDTPPTSRDRVDGIRPQSIIASSSHCPSCPSHQSKSWGNAICSRWVHKNKGNPSSANGGSSNYGDALTNLGNFSLADSEKADDFSDSEAETEGSAHTRGPQSNKMNVRRSVVALEDGTSIHHGVHCKSCKMSPIIGMRYHCASCVKGADFCADCERTGYAIRASVGHENSHLIIRLAAPLDSSQAVDALGAVLLQAQKRLSEQIPASSHRMISSRSASSPLVQTTNTTIYSNKAIKCSFCISPILSGPRFLCANCPLVSSTTLDGFNLCSSCQEHSLQCHDPSHFFIKINPIQRERDNQRRVPLGERWEVREVTKGGPLLPTLYSEVEPQNPHQPPSSSNGIRNQSIRIGDGLVIENNGNTKVVKVNGGSGDGAMEIRSEGGSSSIQFGSWGLKTNSAEARRRAQEIEMSALRESRARHLVPLETLVHPSILCDNCFSVIQGIWYRCCHCTTSFDLCDMCESRIAHDPSHSFAVFKQPVDLDLFKSCVDHQDAGEGLIGASRPMLSFPLL